MTSATKPRRVKVSELKIGDRVRFRLGADESWRTGTVTYVPERFSSAMNRGGKVVVRTEPQPDGYDRAGILSRHTIELID